MALPVRYSVRSMMARRTRSALTVLGVAVAVFVSVMMLALSRGLIAGTAATGSPDNVLVLSLGAESMEFSAIEPGDLHRIRGHGGVARGADGEPLASPEAFINTHVRFPEGPAGDFRGVVRGVLPVAFAVHEQVRMVRGERPGGGFQIAVGRLAATKLGVPDEALQIGRSIEFEGQSWKVVGVFEAPGTLLESQIWADLDDVQTAARRTDYSAVTLKTASGAAAEELLFDLTTRTDVRVTARRETDYYAAAAENLRPIALVSFAVAALLTAAAALAGMNTMFTAILGRSREMAILIVRGYRRGAVLGAFVLESMVLCLGGGAIGVVAGACLDGLPMRVPMGAFRFAVDAHAIGTGLVLSALIGLVGAAVPLLRVARRPVVDALRAE